MSQLDIQFTVHSQDQLKTTQAGRVSRTITLFATKSGQLSILFKVIEYSTTSQLLTTQLAHVLSTAKS